MTTFNINYEPRGIIDVIQANWYVDKYDDGLDLGYAKHKFKCTADNPVESMRKLVASAATHEFQVVEDTTYTRDGSNGRATLAAIVSNSIFCLLTEGSGDVWKLEAWAPQPLLKEAMAAVAKKYPVFHASTVHWWYQSTHGLDSTPLVLEKPLALEPAMYPQAPLNGDPMGYMKDYFESRASILFMMGPPGTGKTSLIRNFLFENDLTAYVAYDETVLRGDSMFISFLNNKNADILVLEDVTELLHKREMDKNEMMARFLNVSDGLVQFPKKKIIFTTNLHNLNGIDSALLRPGRCFDVAEIGAMSFEEAQIACKTAGLPLPTQRREYLMSELYNQSTVVHEIPKIGLVK